MKNDFQIEKLLVELKEYTIEKERLMEVAQRMIEEYQNKVYEYQDDIIGKEHQIRNIISTLIDKNEMKETKTQFNHKLISGKIIIAKDKYSIILKDDYDIDKIPEEYIKTKKSVDWMNYKKQLIRSCNEVIDKETGEIIDNAAVKKIEGGSIQIKLND